jgi:hypothetical protein
MLDVKMRPNEDLPLRIERNGQILTPSVKLQSEKPREGADRIDRDRALS